MAIKSAPIVMAILTLSVILNMMIDRLTTPGTLYAGTNGGGVFVSLDGGESWASFNDGLGTLDITRLEISLAEPFILYAGTSHGGIWSIPLEKSTYTITASAGNGGSIEPDGDIVVGFVLSSAIARNIQLTQSGAAALPIENISDDPGEWINSWDKGIDAISRGFGGGWHGDFNIEYSDSDFRLRIVLQRDDKEYFAGAQERKPIHG